MTEVPGPHWWHRLSDEPGLLGRVRRQWPWVVVLVFVAIGLTLIVANHWRWGAASVGCGMVAAGVFRTVMRSPGIIAIRRHRWIDLVFYYGLGIATVVFAIIVPTP